MIDGKCVPHFLSPFHTCVRVTQVHQPVARRPHVMLRVQGRYGGDGKGYPEAFPSPSLK